MFSLEWSGNMTKLYIKISLTLYRSRNCKDFKNSVLEARGKDHIHIFVMLQGSHQGALYLVLLLWLSGWLRSQQNSLWEVNHYQLDQQEQTVWATLLTIHFSLESIFTFIWLAAFSHETSFCRKLNTDREIMIIHIWEFGRHKQCDLSSQKMINMYYQRKRMSF